MPDGAQHLVFISHATKDRWIARQMAEIIERSAKRYGVVTFLDEVDIAGGDRILDCHQGAPSCMRGVS